MTRKLVILASAQADLQAIWDYGVCEHGVDAASAYIRRLDQSMQMALQYPGVGSDYGDSGWLSQAKLSRTSDFLYPARWRY